MNGEGRWKEIPLPMSDAARSMARGLSLVYGEFDTSDPDDSEAWRRFLYDPLRTFAEDGLIGDRDGWRVVTTIVNHHRPLNPRIGMATALLKNSPHEAAIMIYKLEEDGGPKA